MNVLRVEGSVSLALLAVSLVTTIALPASAQQTSASGSTVHHEADTLPITHRADETSPSASEPQSLEINAGGIAVRFGGFVKLDFIQDFDFVGNADQFKVASIPVDGDPNSLLGGSTNLSARATQFNMDIRGDTGNGVVRAYVEGDFFGSDNSFRLRQGYGEWNGLLAGQTWSTFQDITARPFTLDYEGPDSEFFVRQPMIRYTRTMANGLEWAVAAEDPDSQVSTAGGIAGQGRSEFPDLVARVRVDRQWGHAQAAAIGRQLRFVSNDGAIDETATGFGLNLSGSVKVLGANSVMGHVGFGSGIGRYIESFGGTGSDALLTTSGSLEPIDAWATVLGYLHHWNDRLNSTFSASTAELDNEAGQGGSAIKSAQSVHANLAYSPSSRILVGVELMWGERENNDGAKGDASRLQVTIQYKFR